MTPILVLFLGFQPTVAVGTDLFHGAIFKSVGALRHRRLGTVHGRLSGWMLLGSAPMSLVGVGVAAWLKNSYGDGAEAAERYALGVALLAGGIGVLVKSVINSPAVPDGPFVMSRRDRLAAVAIGLVGGFVVGLTSVGSGVFFALTMLIVFPLRARKVVGTDILHAAALLWVAGVGHLVAGNVDLHAVAWLLIGSVPGVLVGSELPVRIKNAHLQLILGGVLVSSAIKLLLNSSLGTAAALLAGGSATLTALVLTRTRGRGGLFTTALDGDRTVPGADQSRAFSAFFGAGREASEAEPEPSPITISRSTWKRRPG